MIINEMTVRNRAGVEATFRLAASDASNFKLFANKYGLHVTAVFEYDLMPPGEIPATLEAFKDEKEGENE